MSVSPPLSVKKALSLLGIDNLLLGIHDAALPSRAEEDIGRGSPYSHGAAEFFRFVRGLGFDGIQFGPQGLTSPGNPSPYDGTLFSRNPLSLAPLGLNRTGRALLEPEEVSGLIDKGTIGGERVDQDRATRNSRRIVNAVRGRSLQILTQEADAEEAAFGRDFAAFRRRNAEWLERDALYEVLQAHYGGRSWREWGNDAIAHLDRQLPAPSPGNEPRAQRRIRVLQREHAAAFTDYALVQFLLAEQHAALQARCRNLGLKLFGDFQVGFSARDAWAAQAFLLPDYLLGAPPSRTNQSGQPWNYPLLDPRHYSPARGEDGSSGPATHFLRCRVDKLLDEFDGLRIDHPHGLICPWVYRAGQAEPVQAVQAGARLFASPDLVDHPELAEFAIVRPDQLKRGVERHADDWVANLDSGQVAQYAVLFEVIMAAFRERGRGKNKLACEILSTQPYPLQRVMERYGLGRFRVTQKADLDKPGDVYRSENARPEDWLMLGNHDTPSIWQVARNWIERGQPRAQASYLAERLHIPHDRRLPWIERTAGDAGALVQAKFAELFLGPARNIMVFFTDLLGMAEVYNRPGSVSEDNWSLRVPGDYPGFYAGRLRKNLALNLPAALAMALQARYGHGESVHEALIAELESLANAPGE